MFFFYKLELQDKFVNRRAIALKAAIADLIQDETYSPFSFLPDRDSLGVGQIYFDFIGIPF